MVTNPTANTLDYFVNSSGTTVRRGVVAQPPPPPVPTQITLLDQNFDTWPLGSISVTYWNQQMGGGGNSTELTRHQVISNPDLGGRCIQLTCLAGLQGSNGSTAMNIPLSQPVRDVTMTLVFKYVAPYDYGKGQKIPGPVGVRSGFAMSYPSGCKNITDEGYSARCMQKNLTGRVPGSGLTYTYGKDVTDAGWTCGMDNWWDAATRPTGFVITDGVFHTLETRVWLNDSTASNGIVTTKLDGVTHYTASNRQLRVRDDVLTTGIMWHWFYGGATNDWAPTTDQHIWIDSLKVVGTPDGA